MTIYFISRHVGARDWAEPLGMVVDRWVDHLNLAILGPGGLVLGALQVHLATWVYQRSARHVHLAIDLARCDRGRELTAEDLRLRSARLEGYDICRFEKQDGAPAK